jgi:integrase
VYSAKLLSGPGGLLAGVPARQCGRDLALVNLAIDSKLRGCDLVALRVGDIALSGAVRDRGIVVQRKTGRPVQFEITEQTRIVIQAWMVHHRLGERDFLFPSRAHSKPHMSTRQCGRIVDRWVSSIGLDPKRYGTHSMRRTKASLIYKKTGNIRAVQLLLGPRSWKAPCATWESTWMMR